MLSYDHRDHVSIIFQLRGSILPKCLPIGIFELIVGLALSSVREVGITDDIFDNGAYIEDAFGGQILAVTIGYLLVMRTNMALARWMDGTSQVQLMLSKWMDAYTYIDGFFATVVDPVNKDRITRARIKIGHYFSLMSCLSLATFLEGSHADISDLPILAKFPPNSKQRSFKGDSASNSGATSLLVLHAPTADEVNCLNAASDKVGCCALWITQALMMEVRDDMLDTPAPILLRAFQELANGMLGFHQSQKIAMAPFPFPFSQLVTYLLSFLYGMMPLYIDMFTKSVALTPVICFFFGIAFSGLNQLAVELEEPFAADVNSADLQDRHSHFIEVIDDILVGALAGPPISKSGSLERTILDGVRKQYPYEDLATRCHQVPAEGASTSEIAYH